MLQMLRKQTKRLMSAIYACLVVSFGVGRLGVCGWLLVLFTMDVASFGSTEPGPWTLIGTQYAVFCFVWGLSWFFVYQELSPVVRQMRTQRRRKRQVAKNAATQAKKPGVAVQSKSQDSL